MARNRSEKSPSGDPMVDEALRAWLRLELARWRGGGVSGEVRNHLRILENAAYEALNSRQLDLRARVRVGKPYSVSIDNLIALYGHEPEFQNGTQQK